MEVRRYSKQREAILQNLKQRCDHPSADMVYESIRSTMPNISLGTVYRNLNTLSEDGAIIRFFVNGKERFDGNLTPHVHFVCTNCGDIHDIFHGSVDTFLTGVTHLLDCTVSSAQLVIHGKCNECHL